MGHPSRLRARGLLAPVLLSLLVVSSPASPADAPAPARVFDAALARQRDAETLKVLPAEGRLLYQRARVKLDGYRYCSMAVAQAERGELNIDFLGDLPVATAKAWLEQFDGVGPKTAAIVLCFALNMPAFPVDTHVHRVGQRIGFLPEGISADKAHAVMEAIVPPDDYYAFHLNLIRHGREVCQARRPRCEVCPLMDLCDYYQAYVKVSDEG